MDEVDPEESDANPGSDRPSWTPNLTCHFSVIKEIDPRARRIEISAHRTSDQIRSISSPQSSGFRCGRDCHQTMIKFV